MTPARRPAWRTSSYSGQESNCVEVAPTMPEWRVRDTKDRDGGTLTVSSSSWQALTAVLGHKQI
jgi:hypothetical protein